jgi:coenzyme PQQ precursor peptide PqqA
MIVPYDRTSRKGIIDPTCESLSPSVLRRDLMKWETPEAIDLRFGMEITMYISNR